MFDYIRKIIENRETRANSKFAAATEAIRTKVAAETEAIKTATKMMADADRAIKTRNRILVIVGKATFLLLLGDFIYHDSETFIKWNMKRHIRKGSSVVNSSPSSTPKFTFPRNQLPSLTSLPMLIVGPSGCGTSTVLTDLALKLKSEKIPVVYVNFRELELGKPEVDKSKVADKEAPRLGGDYWLYKLAILLCDSSNFPYRSSILAQLMPVALFDVFDIRLPYKDLPRDFYIADKVLDLLFKCCVEIAAEGTTTVLLFDEVNNMIRNKSLEKAGGDFLFRFLGKLLCVNCVDNKYVEVRAVAASSSLHAVTQFRERTRLKDDKLRVFRLSDIEPELIFARLVERGYSESEATKILDVVGPRLRKLEGPLTEDPRPELHSWIKQQMEIAAESFELTFDILDRANRCKLISLLDMIARTGPVFYFGEYEEFIDTFDLSRILYISNAGIIFQSRLHENYWAQNRERLKENHSQYIQNDKC